MLLACVLRLRQPTSLGAWNAQVCWEIWHPPLYPCHLKAQGAVGTPLFCLGTPGIGKLVCMKAPRYKVGSFWQACIWIRGACFASSIALLFGHIQLIPLLKMCFLALSFLESMPVFYSIVLRSRDVQWESDVNQGALLCTCVSSRRVITSLSSCSRSIAAHSVEVLGGWWGMWSTLYWWLVIDLPILAYFWYS